MGFASVSTLLPAVGCTKLIGYQPNQRPQKGHDGPYPDRISRHRERSLVILIVEGLVFTHRSFAADHFPEQALAPHSSEPCLL